MSEVRYLTLEDALAAAQAFLGSAAQVRDYGLLESALGRPQVTVYGEDAYPTLHLKAAALLSSLVGNHPLVDGNKRLGWVCVRLFYVYNGFDVKAPNDDAYDLVISIADRHQGDLVTIAGALGSWAVPAINA